MSAVTGLRELIDSGRLVETVGAHDALSARMIERAGFDAVYVGSYSTEASFLGGPDLALMSKSERVQIVRNIARRVGIPVIADAEEGYGNAINVMDTVRDFEAAGASAIHLDDELMPCKCPFLPGIPRNQLISTDEMAGKIRAATEARTSSDFLIIARCDLIGTMDLDDYRRGEHIDEVVRRSRAYRAAGADLIFVMALDPAELAYFRAALEGPLLGVYATIEPIEVAEFRKANYQIVIGTLVSLYLAAKGLRDGLAALKATGDWNKIQDFMIDDREFFDIVGLTEYRDLYERYAIGDASDG